MPITNTLTAQAATQTVQTPLRQIRLLGVFQTPTENHVLLRTYSGDIIRLSSDTPTQGLRLVTIGDGWAMVEDGDTLHRLVIG